MKSNQKNTDNLQDNLHINQNLIASAIAENPHYLYPNGHRITHQMRWFKGSRDMSLRDDIAA